MITYAQNFEDVMLQRLFREVEKGFYIDIGAWDPTVHSVTRHFYLKGWRGVNVEPIKKRWEMFEEQNPEDINLWGAIGSEAGVAPFFECKEESYLSTLDAGEATILKDRGLTIAEREVQVIAVADLFNQHVNTTVDFLKIDVEGFEAEILGALDLRQNRPRALVVEATQPATEPVAIERLAELGTWDEWEAKVLSQGYIFAHFDGLNRFYIREEDGGLAKRLTLPPNVFDHLQSYENMWLVEEKKRNAATLETLHDVAQERLEVINELKKATDDLKLALKRKEEEAEALETLRDVAQERLEVINELKKATDDLKLALKRKEEGAEALETLRDVAQERLEVINELKKATDDLKLALKLKEEEAEALQAFERQRALLESGLPRGRFSLSAATAWVKRKGWRFAEGALSLVKPPPELAPRPSFTIVTPVLNDADTLRATIESVLSQENVQVQYIIVDGGSRDGSKAIIDEYRDGFDLLISEPNEGLYDAVGKGFRHSTNDVLAYIKPGDVYEAGALGKVGDIIATNIGQQIFYHQDSVSVRNWRFPEMARTDMDPLMLWRGHDFSQHGYFVTRNAYDYIGGMNRSLQFAGDWELLVRLSRHFRFTRVPGHVRSVMFHQDPGNQKQETYLAEVATARSWLGSSYSIRARAWPRYAWNRAASRMARASRRLRPSYRLFFPFAFAYTPPPFASLPSYTPNAPLSPLDRSPPTRLLFSSEDTRFGNSTISYLYHHARDHIVSSYPPLDVQTLRDLKRLPRERDDQDMQAAAQNARSPYAHFRPTSLFAHVARKVRLPCAVRAGATRTGLLDWADRSVEEIEHATDGLLPDRVDSLRFLDIGCQKGVLLDQITDRKGWETFGVEPDQLNARMASKRGHGVWTCQVEDILDVLPSQEYFDIVFIGQAIHHFNDPLAVVIRLSMLLASDGLMVLSTPNLNSAQIDMFGPTWAHWAPPHSRHIFSPRSMERLANCAGMEQRRYRTYSHPSWSRKSQELHSLGVSVNGAVSPGSAWSEGKMSAAETLAIVSRLVYDWRGRGDYMYSTFTKPLK